LQAVQPVIMTRIQFLRYHKLAFIVCREKTSEPLLLERGGFWTLREFTLEEMTPSIDSTLADRGAAEVDGATPTSRPRWVSTVGARSRSEKPDQRIGSKFTNFNKPTTRVQPGRPAPATVTSPLRAATSPLGTFCHIQPETGAASQAPPLPHVLA